MLFVWNVVCVCVFGVFSVLHVLHSPNRHRLFLNLTYISWSTPIRWQKRLSPPFFKSALNYCCLAADNDKVVTYTYTKTHMNIVYTQVDAIKKMYSGSEREREKAARTLTSLMCPKPYINFSHILFPAMAVSKRTNEFSTASLFINSYFITPTSLVLEWMW